MNIYNPLKNQYKNIPHKPTNPKDKLILHPTNSIIIPNNGTKKEPAESDNQEYES